MLGTSDALKMSHLSKQPSKPAYHIVDCRISDQRHASKFVYFCFSGMRTARNIFIATLAVGDSALCLLTMPMTLLGVLTKYWPFGPSTWILCKIVRTSPAITVFFSSYTMAIIAIDRHRFIVHSTKRQVCTSCHS